VDLERSAIIGVVPAASEGTHSRLSGGFKTTTGDDIDDWFGRS
jgi:hypothetical protein